MNNLWSVDCGYFDDEGEPPNCNCCYESTSEDEGNIEGYLEEQTDAESEGADACGNPVRRRLSLSNIGESRRSMTNTPGRRNSDAIDFSEIERRFKEITNRRSSQSVSKGLPELNNACSPVPAVRLPDYATPPRNMTPLGRSTPLNLTLRRTPGRQTPMGNTLMPPNNISLRRLPAARNALNTSLPASCGPRKMSVMPPRKDLQQLRAIVRSLVPRQTSLKVTAPEINISLPHNFPEAAAAPQGQTANDNCYQTPHQHSCGGRPLSALQASYERQRLLRKQCGAPIRTTLAIPRYTRQGAQEASCRGYHSLGNLPANLCTGNGASAVTSFMVPNSMGNEICIRTPVQVEIVKTTASGDRQSYGQDGNCSCTAHQRRDRNPYHGELFKYSKYPYATNCSEASNNRYNNDVPNLCGRCVTPFARRTWGPNNQSNRLQVPNIFTAHQNNPGQRAMPMNQQRRSSNHLQVPSVYSAHFNKLEQANTCGDACGQQKNGYQGPIPEIVVTPPEEECEDNRVMDRRIVPGLRTHSEIREICRGKGATCNKQQIPTIVVTPPPPQTEEDDCEKEKKEENASFLKIIKNFTSSFIVDTPQQKTSKVTPEIVVTPPSPPKACVPEIVVTPPSPTTTVPEIVVTPPSPPRPSVPQIAVTPPSPPRPSIPQIVVTPATTPPTAARPSIVVTPATPPRPSNPEIVVTPPTPSSSREPNIATASFGNFGRTSGSTTREQRQSLPTIVISDCDMPRIVLQEGQQFQYGRPHVTARDCGFCQKLASYEDN